MDIYRTGFVGGSTEESTEWMAQKATGYGRICVPFAGIGRSIAAMAERDTYIESWDTMIYARAIIEGVFAAREIESNVDKIHYKQGWMYQYRTFKNIDDRCAGFIDWVAANGTLFDKACMISAMCRSTLMGRMRHWHSNIEGLWSRFNKQREYNREWIGLPAEFVHHEGNFFDRHLIAYDKGDVRYDEYDLLEIDPPKVVNYSDVYSLHFEHINRCMGGSTVRLPKWTRRNSMGYFRKCMEVRAPRVIFMYTSKVFPEYEVVKKVLQEYGKIEEEVGFTHQGRTDYGLLITR